MNRPGEKDVVGLDIQMDNVLAVYKFKTLQSKLTWIFLGHIWAYGMFGEYERVHLDYLPHENSTFFLRKSIVWF